MTMPPKPGATPFTPPPPGQTGPHGPPLQFSAPQTFSQGVKLAFSRHLSLVAVALVCLIPSTLIGLLITQTLEDDVLTAIQNGDFGGFLRSNSALILLASLITGYLGSVILQGVLALAAFQHLRDGSFSVKACVNQCLARAFPLLGACLLQGLLLLLIMAATALVFAYVLSSWIVALVGFLLALVVYVRLYVIVPAAVCENSGGPVALSRSTELTAGRRWSVLGLILLGVLIAIGIGIIEEILGSIISHPLFILIMGTYTSILLALFNGLFAGLTYFGLRGEKEGISLDGLEKIFD